MKKILSAFIVLCASSLFAGELFVAPNGNDSNPGTQAEPLATLEAARDRIQASANAQTEAWTVNLAEGEYAVTKPMEFKTENSGSPEVVYRGAANGKTVLTGGIELKNWSDCGDGT